ncbi:MAG: hypothetical protein OEL66_02550, partial [Desulfobulbaceae bacterium]|nr:hypothetical protein [Desulfobulbaceae bacterium]
DESFIKNAPSDPASKTLKNATRLWIHIRKENQRNEAENIYKLINDIKLNDMSIEQKPIQVIDYGPEISQLRYFKKEDKMLAEKLFTVLSEMIPTLTLQNFSDSYSDASWLLPGHFELWIAHQQIIPNNKE